MKLIFATILALCQNKVSADMYMQFPGGGNNRLNEPNRARRNNNRLFDSQNNNRFGHNQAGFYFFTGSEIDMQWTMQHSCGPESSVNCEVIVQYACHDQIRDGQTVTTIPVNKNDCANKDCNSDFKYGMHEKYEEYQHCSLRERQKGLFPADRRLRGDNARYTRQEERGTRYGYECNEERDHYPYWHPTIWSDIAVFTDDTSRCNYYQTESENVKGRWYCSVPQTFLDANYQPGNREQKIPNNKEGCDELPEGTWTQSQPNAFPNGKAQPAPVCLDAPYQRDNHHGSGDGRDMVGYKWTVPEDLVSSSCVLRIRYNMTNSDFDGWNTDAEAKSLVDRLDNRPSTFNGQCLGLGEGALKAGYIASRRFEDIVPDMATALTIDPRGDGRIKFTRATPNDDWSVTTTTRSDQRFGWRSSNFGNKKIKLSFEINFSKKATGGNQGVLYFSQVDRDWLNDANLNEWYTYTDERILPNRGSGETIQLIFDRVSVAFQIRNIQLCVIDELAEKGSPFKELQDVFGFGPYEAKTRGYVHRNDARIRIFDDIRTELRLAYNTDQLGRTFEDRSHKLKFVALEDEVKADVANGAKVYNLNARGKIGNNVEVYPAFEYSFAPRSIKANEGDYLHIQFSGSNTNDQNNDSSHLEPSGRTVRVLRGKDRHNMVAIDSFDSLRPSTDKSKLNGLLGFSAITSMCIAFGGVHGGDNEYLQSAGAYFDNENRKLTKTGKHMFMAPINTKFATRYERGKVNVAATP